MYKCCEYITLNILKLQFAHLPQKVANVRSIVAKISHRAGADRQGRTVSQMVGGGAPLAVTGLSNLGEAWLFLDFKNLFVKIEPLSSLILKHVKNN